MLTPRRRYGDCSYKSDVFSLGVCLLEVWLGRVFEAGEEDEGKLKRARAESE